jgi:hypothetical protein
MTLFVIFGIAAFAIGFLLVGWCVLAGWWLDNREEMESRRGFKRW